MLVIYIWVGELKRGNINRVFYNENDIRNEVGVCMLGCFY